MVKKTFTVPACLNQVRVDWALAQLMDGTRSHAQALIKAGCVTLNGVLIEAPKQKVREKDFLAFEEFASENLTATPRPLDVLYEDSAILVLNKPAGLVVHPAPGHKADTLANALAARADFLSEEMDPLRPGIVHRLDKDTTGLLVVAKTNSAHAALARQFRPFDEEGKSVKTASRTYLGLVYGSPTPSRGRIQNNLGRHRVDRQRWTVCLSGKTAITDYETVRRWSLGPPRTARSKTVWISLVRFHLLTGRTHQIRVHCEHAGFPLVGDPVYTSHAPHGGTWPVPVTHFPRQALHAASLQFIHPVTQTPMLFEAPLPDDMAQLLETLTQIHVDVSSSSFL